MGFVLAQKGTSLLLNFANMLPLPALAELMTPCMVRGMVAGNKVCDGKS